MVKSIAFKIQNAIFNALGLYSWNQKEVLNILSEFEKRIRADERAKVTAEVQERIGKKLSVISHS